MHVKQNSEEFAIIFTHFFFFLKFFNSTNNIFRLIEGRIPYFF